MADNSDENIEKEFKEELEKNGMTAAASKLKDYLEKLDKVTLNIAITGESGSGKSSFVNVVRRLGDEDEGSALTGVVETTLEPKDYPHPDYPNVHLWDLPGMGTLKFPAETYLEKVKFDCYDFFIIVSNERFKENDVKLALEIQKKKKKFYFVRSKIDSSLYNERRKKSFNEEETKKKIKDHCIEVLEKQGITSPTVFLISSFHLDKYDFPALMEKIAKDLPSHKRDALLTCLPNISLEIHQKKKKYFQSNMWIAAAASAAGGLLSVLDLTHYIDAAPGGHVPVVLVSYEIDAAIIESQVTKYYNAFGLDPKSLQRIADRVGVDVKDLKSVMKSPLSNGITREVILKLIQEVECSCVESTAKQVAHVLLRLLPVVCSFIACRTTYTILDKCLNELADDAQNVLIKVLDIVGAV